MAKQKAKSYWCELHQMECPYYQEWMIGYFCDKWCNLDETPDDSDYEDDEYYNNLLDELEKPCSKKGDVHK